jgi:UDP-3-O-[3-hydroxymyristoyl] glucosamine N-acyltransferase
LKISVQDIASKVEGRIIGEVKTVITGVNSLESACEGEISFYSDSRYKDHLSCTRASAIIVRDILN